MQFYLNPVSHVSPREDFLVNFVFVSSIRHMLLTGCPLRCSRGHLLPHTVLHLKMCLFFYPVLFNCCDSSGIKVLQSLLTNTSGTVSDVSMFFLGFKTLCFQQCCLQVMFSSLLVSVFQCSLCFWSVLNLLPELTVLRDLYRFLCK